MRSSQELPARSLGSLAAFLLLFAICAPALQITVAADGSGDYKTIQAAVDSVPAGNRERAIIYIRNGAYAETVRINNSYLTLRGQDRKKTRIEAAVDTSACVTPPGGSKEEHCATVIADGTDLVFENLTVANSFRGKGKAAALSVVGDATRIIVHNVDVVGYGGDTLVLSARRWRMGDGAQYYLNDVYVSGTYHIIVPRGTTYAVHCTFWCMGGERNCLFNEGITRESDKLVIRDSVIDGPEPFGLGSYFRDAAWYFVDSSISDRLMPDGTIHREPAENYQLKWGEGRIYFAGNRAPAYPWLKDNLASSPAKSKTAITTAWTFAGWDPESTQLLAIDHVATEKNLVRLVFTEPVTVTGSPRLKLRSGTAAYAGGSGTTTLIFRRVDSANTLPCGFDGGMIYASAASLQQRQAALVPKRLCP